MLTHTCDANTWKAKKGVLPEVQGQLKLKSKAQSGERSGSFSSKLPFRKLGTNFSLGFSCSGLASAPIRL